MHTQAQYNAMAQIYYKPIGLRITYYMDKHSPIKGYLYIDEGFARLDDGQIIIFRN